METLAKFTPNEKQENDGFRPFIVQEKGYIYQDGLRATKVFVIQTGTVAIQPTAADGRVSTADIIDAPTVVGEDALAGEVQYMSSAKALTDVQGFSFFAKNISYLSSRYPDLHLELDILKAITHRLDSETNNLVPLWLHSLEERLVALILNLSKDGRDELPFTHQEVGEFIGTSRQTTTEMLNNLEKDGYVETRRKKVKIQDKNGLVFMQGVLSNGCSRRGHSTRLKR